MPSVFEKYLVIVLYTTLFQSLLFAQKSEPFKLNALSINEKIEIDGDLDEEVWDDAEEISNFTQRELDEGSPATEETHVMILYDLENIYIGVEANDSEPDKIIAKESKRDFGWQSDDNIEIILGPFNNKRDAYLFVVNPNGAIADALISDDGSAINKDWNGVWEAEVQIDDEEGWEIEIKIPFSNFKRPGEIDQIWALNIERNIRRKNEQLLWQGWSRDYDLEKISQAGQLKLSNISSNKLWELKPYFSGGLERNEDKSTYRFKFGGDVNYLFSPKMELNLTVNTDFSQIESDRDEINLSRFSILFPEKRDFFLEGQKLFEFNLGENAQAFYSRRIGLAGDQEERKEIPIMGGLRLVGKADKTNIGMMTIQTSPKDSIETTNFSVLRIKQDIFEQSNIGFIMTSKYDNEIYNFLYGLDANYVTSQLFGDKNFNIGISFSQSLTEKRINQDALAYHLYMDYPNDFTEFHFSTSRISKDYNPQIGFLRRDNYKNIFSELQFNPRPAYIPLVKNLEIKPFELDYYLTDTNNKPESMEYELRPLGVEFKSGDFIEFNIQRFFEHFDSDFELIDEKLILADDYWFTRYEIGLETYEGRTLFSEAQISWGDYYSGSAKEIETRAGINLSNKLNISADWERKIIKLPDNSFTTDEIGNRVEYAFNPLFYTSLFTQWNNEDDEVLLNFRINWIPQSGSYLYFVINQQYDTSRSLKVLNTTILSKLNWFFSY